MSQVAGWFPKKFFTFVVVVQSFYSHLLEKQIENHAFMLAKNGSFFEEGESKME